MSSSTFDDWRKHADLAIELEAYGFERPYDCIWKKIGRPPTEDMARVTVECHCSKRLKLRVFSIDTKPYCYNECAFTQCWACRVVWWTFWKKDSSFDISMAAE